MIIITGEFQGEPFYFIEGEWRRSVRPTFEGYPDYDAARNLAVALANTALHVSGDNCDIRVIDTDAEIDPHAELDGLCPNCHSDSNVTEDPVEVLYCGSCGCVWGEGRQPRLLEREAVPMMMLSGQWPPHPSLGKLIEKESV